MTQQAVRDRRLPETHLIIGRKDRRRRGLTLIEVLLTLLATGALAAGVRIFGVDVVLNTITIVVVLVVLLLLWGAACRVAPDLTRSATAVLLAVFLLAALLPNLVNQAREQARRNQCVSNLRVVAQRQMAHDYARGIRVTTTPSGIPLTETDRERVFGVDS
jgi:Mg2+/Co2+ transporter CorB